MQKLLTPLNVFRLFIVGLIVSALMAAAPYPVPFKAEPMTLQLFLVWVASSGGASILLSFVAERWPGWGGLNRELKEWIHLGGSVALALAAFAILTLTPPEILESAAPWFLVVYGVASTWVLNQLAHKADPANKPKQ